MVMGCGVVGRERREEKKRRTIYVVRLVPGTGRYQYYFEASIGSLDRRFFKIPKFLSPPTYSTGVYSTRYSTTVVYILYIPGTV
jgi:hypothetical protein